MEQNMKELEKELKKIDEIVEKRPVYAEILNLYKAILTLKDKYQDIFECEKIDIDEKAIEKRIDEGFAVLRKDKMKIDIKAFERYFLELVNLFEEKNKEFFEDLKTAVFKEELNLEETIRDVLIKGVETEEKEDGVKEGILWKDNRTVRLLIYEALKPFFEIHARLFEGKIRDELWGKGYCPVCGERPMMAELRGEEGKRMLRCSLCAFEWSFMRVKCPFCENEDQEELGYLSIEGEPNYRVNFCKQCKAYLKAIDPREIGEEIDIFLGLEDVATLHLDVLAEKEGFHKENPNLFYSSQD